MFIIQCDKCKIQASPKPDVRLADGWRPIQYRTTEYGSPITHYHICPSCAEKLKLPPDKDASLADQFLDILSELAAEAVEDAIANR